VTEPFLLLPLLCEETGEDGDQLGHGEAHQGGGDEPWPLQQLSLRGPLLLLARVMLGCKKTDILHTNNARRNLQNIEYSGTSPILVAIGSLQGPGQDPDHVVS